MTIPTAPAFCGHGRLADGCEDCLLIAAMERGYRPQPGHFPAPVDTETADVDLLIDHRDGRYTLVNKGDEIPRQLAHLPRVSRDPAGEKPARSKRGS